MASKGTPLGIGLAIDFGQLDSQLSMVADKIERVGSDVSLKVGSLAGMAAKGDLGADKIGAQVSQIGVSLSQGMASGVRASSAVLLGLGARISAMVDRIGGVMITMFNRIDTAMKGHRWTNMLTGLSNSLGNFASGAGKSLSPLDKAMGGAFGGIAKRASAVFNTMFENLGKTITDAMTKASSGMTDAMTRAAGEIKAAMKSPLDSVGESVKKLATTMSTSMAASIDAIATKMRSLGSQGQVDLSKLGHPLSSEEYLKKRDQYKEEPKPKRYQSREKGLFAEADMSKFFASELAQVKPPKRPQPPPERFGFGLGGTGTAINASFKDAIRDVKAFGQHLVGFKPTKSIETPRFSFTPTMGAGIAATLREGIRSAMKLKTPSTGGEAIELKQAGQGFVGTLKQAMKQVGEFGKHIADFKVPLPPPQLALRSPAPRYPLPPRVNEPAPAKIPSRLDAVKDAAKDVTVAIKNIPTAFQAAAASGNRLAVAISGVGGLLRFLGHMTADVVIGVARIGAGLGAMGFAAAAAIGRTISFFQTLGGVGKATYGDLFRGNNIFVAAVLASAKTVYHLTRGLFDLVTLRAFRRVGDDAKQFGGAVQTATGMLGRLSGAVGRLGVEMAAAFGVVGLVYKTVQFFQKGVKSASDLNAEVARSKVVFGESFGPVAEQVEKNAKAFNVSKTAQMELTSSFGSMAQGAGVSEAKSADLATELNALAIDMTGLGVSFNEASEAMKTGLSGRAISLKQFSVNIDDNTTKAFAWKTGIAAAGQELTMQQTLLARAGQMMRGLSYAQGALTAGANTAAVQFQRAGGGVALFAEKIGEILLPSVQSATKGFNTLLGGVLSMVDAAGPKIQEWSMSASGVIDTFIEKTAEFGPTILENLTWAWEEAKKGPLGFVIEGTEAVISFAKAVPEAIGIAVRNAGTLWEIAKLRVGDFVNNAIAYIQTIPANFGIIFPWILKNWRTLLVDLGEALKTIGGNLLENAKNLGLAVWEALKGGEFKFEWTPLLDGFKATTEKLPDLIKPAIISSQAEIDKLYAKIGQDELNKLKPKPGSEAAMMGKKPPILPEDKSKEYKLGGALESGTKEAFSAISKGMSGRSSTTDAVKQGVVVQKDIHKAITQQTEVLKGKAFTPALSVK